jgi:hypothetical protein
MNGQDDRRTTQEQASETQIKAYLTIPLMESGEEVQAQKCPENQVVSRDSVAIFARGCTEDEAKRKVYKELIKQAKKLRRESKVGDCTGDCKEGACTLTTAIAPGELDIIPAEVQGCPDDVGFVCTFIGKVRAECLCAI